MFAGFTFWCSVTSTECKQMHICRMKTAAAALSHPFVFAMFVLLFGIL